MLKHHASLRLFSMLQDLALKGHWDLPSSVQGRTVCEEAKSIAYAVELTDSEPLGQNPVPDLSSREEPR